MSSYKEIVEVLPNYELVQDSIKFKHVPFPWSIKKGEFDYMKDYIVQNNLKCGYEMATGCGISTLAIGLGFKETNGKLMTMDAYIEEAQAYNDSTPKTVFKESIAYKTIDYMLQTFDLENIVSQVAGWSPDDVSSKLTEVFDVEKEKIDFVFIDACHTDKAVIQDFEAILPYVSSNCTFFFHDLEIGYGCITNAFKNYLQTKFGHTYEIVVPLPRGYNLGMFKLQG